MVLVLKDLGANFEQFKEGVLDYTPIKKLLIKSLQNYKEEHGICLAMLSAKITPDSSLPLEKQKEVKNNNLALIQKYALLLNQILDASTKNITWNVFDLTGLEDIFIPSMDKRRKAGLIKKGQYDTALLDIYEGIIQQNADHLFVEYTSQFLPKHISLGGRKEFYYAVDADPPVPVDIFRIINKQLRTVSFEKFLEKGRGVFDETFFTKILYGSGFHHLLRIPEYTRYGYQRFDNPTYLEHRK